MDGGSTDIKTLADRARDAREGLALALTALDRDLADYARREGGRFIRYGSTATGRATPRSDVDVIAEFPDDCVSEACRFADDACLNRGLLPDVRPLSWCSARLIERALAEGLALP